MGGSLARRPAKQRARAAAAAAAVLALGGCARQPAAGAPSPASPAQPPVAETASPQSASASTPAADSALACARQPDYPWQLQASWMQATATRLDETLPSLSHCTDLLPDQEPVSLSLRLMYDKRGNPLSQHIGETAEGGCDAARCVAESLAELRAPPQEDRQEAAFDLSLLLRRGSPPEPAEPKGPLLQTHEGAASCVDRGMLPLTRERVTEIVATAFEGFKDCHNQALERDHQAAGVVQFEFMLDRGGKVLRARARESTFHDCSAIECMLGHLRQLSFPPPVAGTVRVLYPVHLEVEQPPVQLQQ